MRFTKSTILFMLISKTNWNRSQGRNRSQMTTGLRRSWRLERKNHNLSTHWLAEVPPTVLQCRSLTIQVAWMYWPKELPDTVNPWGAKKSHYGSCELIASDYLQVLDVLSFAGKAEVFLWREEDETLPSKLYYRQTFHRQTQQLSVSSSANLCAFNY